MKFNSFYVSRPKPVGTILDTETKFVDQSEADRCSLAYQLERFGMDGLMQKLEQTKAQFGYADTRLTKDFATLAEKQAEANSYFMQLPAQIRKQFNHDPIEFYTQIETNPKSMFERGFISKELANQLGVTTNIDNNINTSDFSDIPASDIKSSDIAANNQSNIDVSEGA